MAQRLKKRKVRAVNQDMPEASEDNSSQKSMVSGKEMNVEQPPKRRKHGCPLKTGKKTDAINDFRKDCHGQTSSQKSCDVEGIKEIVEPDQNLNTAISKDSCSNKVAECKADMLSNTGTNQSLHKDTVVVPVVHRQASEVDCEVSSSLISVITSVVSEQNKFKHLFKDHNIEEQVFNGNEKKDNDNVLVAIKEVRKDVEVLHMKNEIACITEPIPAGNQELELGTTNQRTEGEEQSEHNSDVCDQNNNIGQSINQQSEDIENMDKTCQGTKEETVAGERKDNMTEELPANASAIVANNVIAEKYSPERTGQMLDRVCSYKVVNNMETTKTINEKPIIAETSREIKDLSKEDENSISPDTEILGQNCEDLNTELDYIQNGIINKVEQDLEKSVSSTGEEEFNQIEQTATSDDSWFKSEENFQSLNVTKIMSINDAGFIDDDKNTSVSDMIGEYVDKIIDELVEPLSQDKEIETSDKCMFGNAQESNFAESSKTCTVNNNYDKIVKYDEENTCVGDENKVEQMAKVEGLQENMSVISTVINKENQEWTDAETKGRCSWKNNDANIMSVPFDDITNSQLAGIDWNSQFPSDSLQLQESKPSIFSDASCVVSKDPPDADNQSSTLEDGSAILAGMIKELSQLNKMVLKSRREMECSRRQQP